jgi:isopentenyl diphosphate isomerase/L-lactate dehydrogenase-like FMN-dependent dehydrogenase
MTSSPSAPAPSQRLPAGIRCAQDYEALARQSLPAPADAYIAGGSGHDLTTQANRSAFGRWAIYPRLLREVSAGHTRIELNGERFAHPLFLAPVAFHKLVHGAGELDTARAAQAAASCLITSTLSSCTLEDVARHAGAQRWFQLYFQPSRDATLDLLSRAQGAGYGAIVVTVDAPIQVASLGALSLQFTLPPECLPVNLAGYPHAAVDAPAAGDSRIFQGVMRAAPTWADLAWLLEQTSLPVWVKGVLHPDDALALVEAGVAGIVVSNHGGRSLDGAPASLDCLAAIRAAVGPRCPILFDGGIRSGADAFKALALGADAVAIGRLQLYALHVAGALGVAHMLKLLVEELEVCMALAGCATIAAISPAALVPMTPPTPPRTTPPC